MLVKVCGISKFDNFQAILAECEANNLFPDYFGFISYKESIRYASPEEALSLLKILPSKVKAVLVSVDLDLKELDKYLLSSEYTSVQLHGEENENYIKEIRLNYPGIKIIKAVRVGSKEDFNHLTSIAALVDLFLFDTKAELPGGNGVKFSWDLLNNYNENTPYFLSGGIKLDDLEQIYLIAKKDQRFIGVDVNSGFEISKGIKDSRKILDLLKNVDRFKIG